MKKLIRRIRKSKGMTQTEFAQAIGVTQATVSMIESGSRQPGRDTLAGLFAITSGRLRQQLEDAMLEMAGVKVLHPTRASKE
jgi:transcriptional regulator with XRE-family HTH domain